MNDWQRVKMDDFLKVYHGFPFPGDGMTDELTGRPVVVSIGNFAYSGGFRFNSTRVREFRGAYPQEFTLTPGDLLVVMTCQTAGGEILGLPGIIPNDGTTYLHNQRIGRVEVNPKLADKRFAYYLFLMPEVNRQLFNSASGTKILHTSPGRIGEVNCTIPSLPEQRAIAEVLGSLDDKIAVNERIAGAVLELGETLLEGSVQTEPLMSTVGDVAELVYGKALPEPKRRAGNSPVFGCTGQVGWHDTPLTPSAGPVVGRKGANAGHVSWMPRPGWVIDTAYYARPLMSGMSVEALYFVLNSAGLKTLIGDSAVPGVNRDLALRQPVRLPTPGLMDEFQEQARNLLQVSVQKESENRILTDLRDTLLPQLVTGKLRIKDAERVVEDAV